MTSLKSLTLNKLIVLILAMTYLGLVVDLRFEHIDIVRRHWTGWIPIVFSLLMVILSVVGLVLWEKSGRSLLLGGYAVSVIVGVLGFWYHNHGQPVDGVLHLLSAWYGQFHHGDAPPTLAPLSFAGLAVFGILASLDRFQPANESPVKA